ncbi:hypothetical protein NUW54_g14693 [Trametes sanguinea]|uniref:Uncharacterized protein n=1 Tax=Trametes sanguinea TaxID=158606 RepID=A0ACC1MCN3_9APHY|nr:hypothetical protein NUW54_g14693 [Trametes sanguinea]
MSDYEPDAQEIAKLAAVYYKGRVAAEDAYPSKLTENTWRAKRGTAQDIGQHEEDHDGLYENDIIQMVVNRVFYKDAEDDGILLSTVYDPFPTRALALVLTAIQCAIDEWSTGVHTNVKFTEDAYLRIYKTHLQDLEDFEAASGEDKILLQIPLPHRSTLSTP